MDESKPKTLDLGELEEIIRSNERAALAVGEKNSVLSQWHDRIDAGWVPAYDAARADAGLKGSLVSMPYEIQRHDFREVCEKYNLTIEVVSGYAFMSRDSIHAICGVAQKKVADARKHAVPAEQR